MAHRVVARHVRFCMYVAPDVHEQPSKPPTCQAVIPVFTEQQVVGVASE